MECEFRCQGCNFYWRGYRVMYHRCVEVGLGRCTPYPCRWNMRKTEKMPGPGMTECPRCAHIYVDWINAREFLESLGDYWNR